MVWCLAVALLLVNATPPPALTMPTRSGSPLMDLVVGVAVGLIVGAAIGVAVGVSVGVTVAGDACGENGPRVVNAAGWAFSLGHCDAFHGTEAGPRCGICEGATCARGDDDRTCGELFGLEGLSQLLKNNRSKLQEEGDGVLGNVMGGWRI